MLLPPEHENHHITVDGNVTQSVIITGNKNQVFIGDYKRLSDACIKPWSVFERVRLEHFVGREWLVNEVDKFLQQNDRGYFILEANAGLGKTTFAAYLVKTRNYIHHFVELARGQAGIVPGLKNLAAQLIQRFSLNAHLINEVIPGSAVRPDFLQNILFEVTKEKTPEASQDKIVLVIDALDEAGILPDQNVLGLPRVLPQGVYFIVTQRPVELPLRVETFRQVFYLESTNMHNLADAQVYLENAAKRERIAEALQQSNYSAERFVNTLMKKCQGVWVYLHYVIGEIEHGKRNPLDLDTLPQGIWQYYAQYWQNWQKKHFNDWDKIHLPLISTLAALQEAASLELLHTLSGISDTVNVRHLLEEDWRPYLVLDEERRYRLYHASLREFLGGRADVVNLTTQEKALALDLAQATHQRHSSIANRYINVWGGIEHNLPRLRDPEIRDLDDRYGLRHIIAHLEAAGRAEDLHYLLGIEWCSQIKDPHSSKKPSLAQLLLYRQSTPQESSTCKNAWYTVHEEVDDTAGYLSDVDRGWRLAEKASAEAIKQGKLLSSLSLELRYALFTASVNSLASNIPVNLLVALVEQKKWTVAHSLAYARRIPSLEQRGGTLLQLASYLHDVQKEDVLQEALISVQSIEDIYWRTNALLNLIPSLPEQLQRQAIQALQTIRGDVTELALLSAATLPTIDPFDGKSLQEVLTSVHTIADPYWRTMTLVRLVSSVKEQQKDILICESLRATHAIVNEEERGKVVAGIALYQAERGKQQEALEIAQAISNPHWRAEAFLAIAPHLSELLLQQMFADINAFHDEYERTMTLARLAPHFIGLGLLQEVLLTAPTVGYQGWRVTALSQLIPNLSELLAHNRLQEALMSARIITAQHWRAAALAGLLPYLTGQHKETVLEEALTAALAIADKQEQEKAIARIALYQAERGKQQEALKTTQTITDPYWKTEAFLAIAPHLSEVLLQQVYTDVHLIADQQQQAVALANLASYMPASLRSTVLRNALAAAQKITDQYQRVKTITKLIPSFPEKLRNRLASKTLQEALALANHHQRAAALSLLAPVLPKQLLQKALAAAQAIFDEDDQATVLTEFIPPLIATGSIQEARAIPPALKNDYWRERALTTLAISLSAADNKQEALKITQTITYEHWRAEILLELVPHLPKTQRQEILAAARTFTDKAQRAKLLAGLSLYLPGPMNESLWKESLDVVQMIADGEDRGRILIRIVSQLIAQNRLQEALKIARDLTKQSWQVIALVDVASHLPENAKADVFHEAFAAVQTITDEESQTQSLAALTQHLSSFAPDNLYTFYKQNLRLFSYCTRRDALNNTNHLLPVILEISGSEALTKTLYTIQDVGRWWP